jgi:outer membrane receptor protein involved in Fe transport
LWQYEVGTKQTLLERRLQVNGSLYYLKWKNIQQLTFLPCGLGFTPNLGEVTGRGGDVKADLRATDALTLGIDLAYTDSYYTNSETIQAGSVPVTIVSAGDHLPGSPWNVDVNAEYVMQQLEHKPYLRLDYQYATAQNSLTQMFDPKNTGSDPNLRSLPEIRVLGMRAGVRFDGFDISVFAQNALNFHTPTYYYRDSQQSVDTNYFYRGLPPRTVGVTAAYRF